MAQAYDPRTQAETGESQIQGHPQQHSRFASLDYMRLCLSQK